MITNINSIETIIRNILIAQSQLTGEYVRNALSVYGTPLDEKSNNILDSIEESDNLIIFELNTRDVDSNVSETEEDEKIHFYQGYRVHVIIYGDNSKTLSNKIIGRLRTSILRDTFRKNDLYLESVSSPQSINEYINSSMWSRCDFDIDISCEMIVDPVSLDYEAENLGDLEYLLKTPTNN